MESDGRMIGIRGVVALAAMLLLSGCRTEMATYAISGSEVAVTLERTKPYFWSDGWELVLIVRHDPACQRRHKLKHVTSEVVRMDVYSPRKGVFILNQAKNWYVTDLKTCAFQEFKSPPPVPGENVGVFRYKTGEFRFFPAGSDSAPTR